MDISQSTKDKLPFSCKYHLKFEPSFLYLNPQAEDILLCSQCLDEPKYTVQSLENFQQMQVLLYSDERTILPKWPPLKNKTLLRDIQKYLQENSNTSVNYQEIIHKHFESLEESVVDHIQYIKKQTLMKYEYLPKIEEELFQCYNQFSSKEIVKEVLKDTKTDFNKAQSSLKVILNEKLSEQEQNEESVLKVFNKYTEYIRQLDSNKLKGISESITKEFLNFSYFPELQIPKDNQQQESDKEPPKESPQLNYLLSLIRNPFNYLTKEVESKLSEILSTLKQKLNELDVNLLLQNNNLLPITLGELSNQQIFLVHQLVNIMKQKGNMVFQEQQLDPNIYPNTKSFFQFLNPKYTYELPCEISQKLPIFEICNLKMQFLISDFAQSSTNLRREVRDQNQVFTKVQGNCDFNDNKIVSTLYLKSNTTYYIIFQASLDNHSFQVGLTSQGLYGSLENDGLFIKLSLHSGDTYQLKKGILENLTKCNLFQLTINLSQQLFEMSDYPENNNIIEIPNIAQLQNVLQQRSYQVGFSLCCPQTQLIIKEVFE